MERLNSICKRKYERAVERGDLNIVTTLKLQDYDRRLLNGEYGKAAKVAIEIIIKIAEIQQAEELIDITHVHIGGSLYTGEYSLKVIEKLQEYGGKVKVPTTINAISVDRKRWKEQGIDAEFAESAGRLAKAFEKMGAKPIFSCTPYIYHNGPNFKDDIVWTESNAIAYANSVIGARTNRHGDFLDICAAITGRAPKAGLHIDENRCGSVLINVPDIVDENVDTSFYTVLGYAVGKKSTQGIPVIQGLKKNPSLEDLKAFSAAVSTSGPVGMYHMVGITPEATTKNMALGGNNPSIIYDITKEDLQRTWSTLSTNSGNEIEMVVMGSPHYTFEECRELALFMKEKKKHANIDFLITTNTHVYMKAKEAGYVALITQFGARFSTDICLCMLNEQMVPNHVKVVMTNSGKFAHYGPGLVNKKVQFGTTEECVRAAVEGKSENEMPVWLK